MKCSYCSGLVTWRGPLTDLTHTQCESCGRQNCQEVETPPEDDEPESEWEHPCPFRGEPTKTPAGEACSACGLREESIDASGATVASNEQKKGLAACPTSRGNLLEIEPNDRRPEESHRGTGEEERRGEKSKRGDAVRAGSTELGARGGDAGQHEVEGGGTGNGAAHGVTAAPDLHKARALIERLDGYLNSPEQIALRDEPIATLGVPVGDNPEPTVALETVLAECRDVFPIPEPGSQLEQLWAQAMGDPMSVPEYVRAASGVAAADAPAGKPPEDSYPDQTILHAEGECGNCLQATIAGVLGWPLAAVPHFALLGEDHWWDCAQAWLNSQGYWIDYKPTSYAAEGGDLTERCWLSGRSPRGFSHAVIGDSATGQVLHDPHPSRAGLVEVGYTIYFFRKPARGVAAAPARELVGWQFRYVFEDQGNRRADWSTVMQGEPTFTSGYRSYNGWQRRHYFEVRRVYADAVEPYVEDPHHKPAPDGVAAPEDQPK